MDVIDNKTAEMNLSPLGFGVMRVPMLPGGTFDVEVHDLIAKAYKSGVNFFDTAYLYLGGHSEELVRDAIVAHYPRDSFYISDKLPIWECKTADDMERIFQTQLERLGSDHIDFYLLHGLNYNNWKHALKLDALVFLKQKKLEGCIRKVGFSFHDEPKILESILEYFDWEFVLLQINYYDWFQGHAKTLYDMVEARSIPCFVMEPLGGGRLVKLPKDAELLLRDKLPEQNPVSFALDFINGLSNVAVVLSGMKSVSELRDNLDAIGSQGSRNNNDEIYKNIVEIIKSKRPLPCTGCGYCADKCPTKVDIPQIFEKYIECKQFEDAEPLDISYFRFIDKSRNGTKCSKCGKCNEYCPQKINISVEVGKIHIEALALFLGNSVAEFAERVASGMKLVLFGAGNIGQSVASALSDADIVPYAFCDNREELWGSAISGIQVISPKELEAIYDADTTGVAIATFYRDDVRTQLKNKDITALN